MKILAQVQDVGVEVGTGYLGGTMALSGASRSLFIAAVYVLCLTCFVSRISFKAHCAARRGSFKNTMQNHHWPRLTPLAPQRPEYLAQPEFSSKMKTLTQSAKTAEPLRE